MQLNPKFLTSILCCTLGLLNLSPAQGSVEIRKAQDVPEPAQSASAPAADNYRVRPNDKLSVKVFQEEDLSGLCIVREDGTVKLPLIDEVVHVGGLTITDVEKRIRALLAKDYVRDPRVAVNMAEMSKMSFSVMGQVNRAGLYGMPNNRKVSVLEAIATGGGFTRLANRKVIYLKRTVGGLEKILTINADEMARNPNGTVYVQEGDVITVKESGF